MASGITSAMEGELNRYVSEKLGMPVVVLAFEDVNEGWKDTFGRSEDWIKCDMTIRVLPTEWNDREYISSYRYEGSFAELIRELTK